LAAQIRENQLLPQSSPLEGETDPQFAMTLEPTSLQLTENRFGIDPTPLDWIRRARRKAIITSNKPALEILQRASLPLCENRIALDQLNVLRRPTFAAGRACVGGSPNSKGYPVSPLAKFLPATAERHRRDSPPWLAIWMILYKHSKLLASVQKLVSDAAIVRVAPTTSSAQDFVSC
jgi:hypothetical protein